MNSTNSFRNHLYLFQSFSFAVGNPFISKISLCERQGSNERFLLDRRPSFLVLCWNSQHHSHSFPRCGRCPLWWSVLLWYKRQTVELWKQVELNCTDFRPDNELKVKLIEVKGCLLLWEVDIELNDAWLWLFNSLSEAFLFRKQTLNVNSTDPGKMVGDKKWRLSGFQIIEERHLCH